MTADRFRQLALALPGAVEAQHVGHPDFRVGRRIFATLGWPDQAWGMVKLTLMQRREFISEAPDTFVPVKGGWGRTGNTSVRLRPARVAIVRRALETALRNIAPKRLREDRA